MVIHSPASRHHKGRIAVSGIIGQRVSLGQENGPEVELIVTGTAIYATYETPDGYPAIYDTGRGLFCYARVRGGRFESTGVPVTEAPPPGLQRHARESDEVRAAKIRDREVQMEQRSRNPKERT
jgi:hypothetical protein